MVDEQVLLTAFLQEELSKIERVVSRAIRDGRALSELAVDLERAPDGKISGGCAPREAVAKRWLEHPHVPALKKMEMAAAIRDTPPNEIPVVLTIRHERFVVCGVRRLEGDVVKPGKPN